MCFWASSSIKFAKLSTCQPAVRSNAVPCTLHVICATPHLCMYALEVRSLNSRATAHVAELTFHDFVSMFLWHELRSTQRDGSNLFSNATSHECAQMQCQPPGMFEFLPSLSSMYRVLSFHYCCILSFAAASQRDVLAGVYSID